MIITVYVETTMNKTAMFEWHKKFKGRWEDVRNDGILRCMKTHRIYEKVKRQEHAAELNLDE